jgi:hypothetical protein
MCAAFPLLNVIDELQFIQDVLGFSASASVILDHTGWPGVVFHFMQIIQDGLGCIDELAQISDKKLTVLN